MNSCKLVDVQKWDVIGSCPRPPRGIMVSARIAKPSLAHQSLMGKILSRMDLVGSLRSVRPSGADCHDISVAERTESVAWHQGQMSDGRGTGVWVRLTFWAISLARDLHGFPRIRNSNNPRFERLLVLRWQKVVELRWAGQPRRRFPHECLSKPQFAEFMNLMHGNPRQSRQFAAADVCMAHWFHATDRAC